MKKRLVFKVNKTVQTLVHSKVLRQNENKETFLLKVIKTVKILTGKVLLIGLKSMLKALLTKEISILKAM